MKISQDDVKRITDWTTRQYHNEVRHISAEMAEDDVVANFAVGKRALELLDLPDNVQTILPAMPVDLVWFDKGVAKSALTFAPPEVLASEELSDRSPNTVPIVVECSTVQVDWNHDPETKAQKLAELYTKVIAERVLTEVATGGVNVVVGLYTMPTTRLVGPANWQMRFGVTSLPRRGEWAIPEEIPEVMSGLPDKEEQHASTQRS